MDKGADVVIVGGGIVGVFIAYHLAQKKVKNLLLLLATNPETWDLFHSKKEKPSRNP